MRLSAILPIAFIAWPALAADLDLASRIDRVTVYPNAALVTRTAPLDLPAGASTVTLRGLPLGIDTDSIQVSARGSALTIGPVAVSLPPLVPTSAPAPALKARIDALTDERDAAATRIEALTAKKAAIALYGDAGPGSLGVDGKPFDVSQWQGAWDAVGNGLSNVLEELRQANRRHGDLVSEIAAAKAARVGMESSDAPLRDVAIAVTADEAARGEIDVSYRVSGASWYPVYEARLGTGSPKPTLGLVSRAQIRQTSGEDWSDIELSVSTVRFRPSMAATEPQPLQFRLSKPVTIPVPGTTTRIGRDQTQAFRFSGGSRFGSAGEAEAMLDAGNFQATYRLPGRATVNQGGSTKSFVLSSRTLTPSLSIRATPEIDPTAYLTVSFTQEGEAPFLPGAVFLNRDGVFVGSTAIRLTAPGDVVDLGFGADDRVKVTRVPVRRRESAPTRLGQTKTDLRVFKTTVRNLHTEPARITVFDRIPYSEDAALVVEQLPDTTAPTEKQPADRRGVMAWTYDYRPGEQKDIRLSYRLTWPSDRDLRSGIEVQGFPGPRF